MGTRSGRTAGPRRMVSSEEVTMKQSSRFHLDGVRARAWAPVRVRARARVRVRVRAKG